MTKPYPGCPLPRCPDPERCQRAFECGRSQIDRGVIKPHHLSGLAALLAADAARPLRKKKGERDTEFVKRIVCAYLNEHTLVAERYGTSPAAIAITAIREQAREAMALLWQWAQKKEIG